MTQCKAAGGRGFTLIEVLVATTVIGVLAGMAAVSMVSSFERARQRATMADMHSIAAAIGIYSVDVGGPPLGNGIADLERALVPRFLGVLPTTDHWGNAYAYTDDGLDSFTIESYGRGGVPGPDITPATSADFDRDIVLVNGQFAAAPG